MGSAQSSKGSASEGVWSPTDTSTHEDLNVIESENRFDDMNRVTNETEKSSCDSKASGKSMHHSISYTEEQLPEQEKALPCGCDANSARSENQPTLSSTDSARMTFGMLLKGHIESGVQEYPCDIKFTAESTDVTRFLKGPSHSVHIYGTIDCPLLSSSEMTFSEGSLVIHEDMKHATKKIICTVRLYANNKHKISLNATTGQFKENIHCLQSNNVVMSVEMEDHDLNEQEQSRSIGSLLWSYTSLKSSIASIEIISKGSSRCQVRLMRTQVAQLLSGNLWDYFGPCHPKKRISKDRNHSGRVQRRLELGQAQVTEVTLKTTDGSDLKLTRYKGGDKGPIMLLHGLGVSGKIFSLNTVEQNYVEFLVNAQFDVWNVDWRASADLAGCMEQWNMDEAARFDVALAVDYILKSTNHTDLQIFCHCAGASVFFIALLQGVLQHKIRSIIASQAGPCLVGGTMNKLKSSLHLPSLMKRTGISGMDAQSNNEGSLLDTTLKKTAWLTTPHTEHCSNPVCHRLVFITHLLWKHENLNQLTHDNLEEVVGYVNSTVVKHVTASVNKGHLVNSKGKDVYLPGLSHKEKRRSKTFMDQVKVLDLPILFCSGAENKVWDPQTTLKSYDMCREAHPHQHYERLVVEGYSHLDILMGRKSSEEVFPMFMPFLEKYSSGLSGEANDEIE